jgi:lactocepin
LTIFKKCLKFINGILYIKEAQMKRKIITISIVLMFVFSLFFGFGNPAAKANDNPLSTKEVVQKVLEARAEYLKKVSKVPQLSEKFKKDRKIDKLPTVTIDGVTIPLDVAKLKHIKNPDDFIQIAIDCPSQPLIAYAKVHHITLKQAASEQLSKMKANHELIKTKLLGIGVDLKNIHDMYVAYNGIAANVRIKDIRDMYKNFGKDNDIARIYNNNFKRSMIHIERLYKPVLANSVPLIGSGSSGVWSDPGVDGTGMYVGVVDTGIDYTHPDFGGHPGISFPTTKVPAGYDFGDNDPDPMDCQGHGTHVSGIIAADGAVKGVAPKAKIVFAKIVQGCGGSASDIVIAEAFDYMADPTNVDGGPEGTHPPVASVNMSFGADYGFVDPNAPDQQAIENCISNGIPVALAAGNAGSSLYNLLGANYCFFPDSASIGSPAVTPNCMAVAASWNSASRYPALTELGSGNKYAYTVGAESPDPVTALGDNSGSGYEYVYCGLGGSPSDFPASVVGKIALIQRGGYYFETKINNAEAAGAIGVIIFNSASGGDSLITMEMGSATLPSVFIGHSAGEALLAKAQAPDGDGTGRVAFEANTYVDIPEPVDTVTNFSSWGPPPDLSFKPDITAPGGGIWSTVPVAQGSYANFSGTSMATPHVAACMALVKEAHPSYTPDQIKTVLMNTSKILTDPNTGVFYSPHITGAGRVDVYNAIHTNATVVNKADGKPFVALGELPDYKTQPVTFTVTVKNDSASAVTYNIFADAQTTYLWFGSFPLPVTVTTNPSGTVTVPANSSVDVTVTIDATGVPDWYGFPYLEGYVVFTPQGASYDPGGALAGQIHIPYMGILGKWNDFNEDDWQFNPLMDPKADDPMSFLSWLFDYPVTWPEITNGAYWELPGIDFYGNLDENAIAFNPNMYYLEADVGALRNMQQLDITINSPSGSLVNTIASDPALPKNPDPSWYPGYWYWLDPYTWQPWWWDGTESNGIAAKDGKYYLTLTATAPKIFNKGSYDDPQVIKFPVSVDRVPPSVAVSWTDNPDGSVTYTWTTHDHAPSSGIWGYGLVIENDWMNMVWLPPTANSYTVSHQLSGPNAFLLIPIDNAMNVGYGNPPVVKVSTKTVSTSAGKLVSVPFTATDPDGDELTMSVLATPVPSGKYFIKDSSVYFKPAAADVGKTFTFTVIATDPAGYSGSDTFKTVVVKPQDTTPPALNLPNVNLNAKQTLNSSSFVVLINAQDDAGVIARTVITDNGKLLKDAYSSLSSFNIPLEEGVNNITIEVYDLAGNVTKESFVLVSDTKPPVVDVPNLPESISSSTLKLSGSVYDAVTGVKALYVNGEAVPVSGGKFDTSLTLKGGKNLITIKAVDMAGNTYTKTFTVVYVPKKTTSVMITLQIGSPYVSVNGISKKIDSEGSKPVIENNRTLLPVRVLIESLGGTVGWDPNARSVTINLNGNTIVLTIGKNTALVNGIRTPIDPDNSKVVPVIINGRTYLPLRFIAENLGAMIDWDAATKTISIYYMP